MSERAKQRAALRQRLEHEFRAFGDDPVEWLILMRERWVERDELRAKRSKGSGFMPWPPCPYALEEDWEQRLHRLVDAPWPCPARDRFLTDWPRVVESLHADGVTLGRGAFAGWGDGEPALVRAVHCLTLHLRPKAVIETGVARGMTTRFILEALAANAEGHLWSIDLPPLGRPDVHEQIAMAVPEDLRDRWTYVRGSSRRRLPRLVAEIGPIDLFVHDSRHTQRNLLFELEHAWGALTPGGAVIADDIDLNCGFHAFTATHGGAPTLACPAEPPRPDIGRQADKGVFGILLQRPSHALRTSASDGTKFSWS